MIQHCMVVQQVRKIINDVIRASTSKSHILHKGNKRKKHDNFQHNPAVFLTATGSVNKSS